jgi:putative ABC transport system ATP-binding protein
MTNLVATLRGVRKTVGSGMARRTLLNGVDLELAAGTLTAVVGRSGSGKSTLLHLLGGLEPMDEGEIEVAGVRVFVLRAQIEQRVVLQTVRCNRRA